MIEKFIDYLIENNYKEFTPKGKPSTVYDYAKRVERICEKENISIHNLSENISFYVQDYGPTGNESEFGKKSHNAYICALKQFQAFLS